MASRANSVKTEQRLSGNEKYLNDLFIMRRRIENLSVIQNARFNSTEIRFLGEIIAARYAGKRLISTEIAKLVCVTRSAVSQIVNKMEKEGVVVRVPDEVDRKIAYIEITETALEIYGEDLKAYADFMGKVVSRLGAEKFNAMMATFEELFDLIDEERAICKGKRKYQRKKD